MFYKYNTNLLIIMLIKTSLIFYISKCLRQKVYILQIK